MFAQITVVGNLGRDPEIKHLSGGGIAANMSVAVNESWLDKQSGERVQKTNWFNVVAYQQGETGLITALIQKYLHQGDLVMFVGTPQNRKWVTQQGEDRYSFEIKLGPQSTVKMLNKKPRPKGEAAENGYAPDPETGADGERPGSETPDERKRRQMADEDIPF
jgi:single-strand DNA-binding protein